ncbi:MAG: HNH endonuclease [Ktedonobacteraceae bacterium]|nr:HNH endonuclease [Ktedonobacteraceae bacterium]
MKKYKYPLGILFVCLLALLITSQVHAARSNALHSTLSSQHLSFAAQCLAQGALPDPICTPGSVFAGVTASEVCTPGYSKSVRNVPTSVKNQVYASYGIMTHSPGEYEIDHHIPLELGGSNEVTNLWPEPASPAPGFHEKDKVENYLHAQVCSGAMALDEAQHEISTNWLDVYKRIS